MTTIWYVLLRKDSQTPILVHWDKHYVLQNCNQDYKIVAVAPVEKDGNFVHIPIINKKEE